MTNQIVAPLWATSLPQNTEQRLRDILSSCGDLSLFFRADDIGKAGDIAFHRLLELFLAHRIPLCPAIVPTWISDSVWQSYSPYQPSASLWCWHQHGYSHTNHQREGKKAEFGDARGRKAVYADLAAGKQKLGDILGKDFQEIFTPPWNRCSITTLECLHELGFQAVSRSKGATTPKSPAPLAEYPVNVDLHTRKEKDGATSWEALYKEMEQAARNGLMGIMLHHLLMNRECFVFLEMMLQVIREYKIPCLTFRELLLQQRTE